MKNRVAIAKRWRQPIAFIIITILSAVNWQLVFAQSNPNPPPIGKIVEASGEVFLQRRGTSQFHRTSVGTNLYSGDLLKLNRGIRAIVFCYQNRQSWRVSEGISGAGNGCPPTSQAIFTPTGPIGPTRSSNYPIPHIITPRRTAILNNKPIFRWYPVAGATSYIVRVSGTGVNWEQEVSTTEIVYLGDRALQPGGIYSVSVKANTSPVVAKEVFNLLKIEDAQRVLTEIEAVNRQDLPDEGKTLILAEIYLKNKLIAEATDKLEDLVKRETKTAAVYYTLGELYGQIGLLDLALNRYLQAIELAKAANDIEAQAQAKTRLAAVYNAMGNFKEAINWLTQAKAEYETLGYQQQINEIEQQLQNLKNQ
jgi:Tetratricopeptide repeat